MNKGKPKDHNIQSVGLENTRICPKSSMHTNSKALLVAHEPLKNLLPHKLKGIASCT